MKLSKADQAKFNKEKWLKWVYNRKESHFFFFCNPHMNILKRKEDAVGSIMGKKIPVCDYPGCTLKADQEFFPNLVDTIKEAEKGPWFELGPDNKFHKVQERLPNGKLRTIRKLGEDGKYHLVKDGKNR